MSSVRAARRVCRTPRCRERAPRSPHTESTRLGPQQTRAGARWAQVDEPPLGSVASGALTGMPATLDAQTWNQLPTGCRPEALLPRPTGALAKRSPFGMFRAQGSNRLFELRVRAARFVQHEPGSPRCGGE
jgi:hypothetical protein